MGIGAFCFGERFNDGYDEKMDDGYEEKRTSSGIEGFLIEEGRDGSGRV